MKITFRSRTLPVVIIEETTYYRVFSWVDDAGRLRHESRRRVIIRDTDGVLRRAYVRER